MKNIEPRNWLVQIANHMLPDDSPEVEKIRMTIKYRTGEKVNIAFNDPEFELKNAEVLVEEKNLLTNKK